MSTRKVKYRPCMDFSRHVNDYISKLGIKLSNIPEAEKLLKKGDGQTYFDLQNMYFHVCMKKSQWPILGFEIESPEGKRV